MTNNLETIVTARKAPIDDNLFKGIVAEALAYEKRESYAQGWNEGQQALPKAEEMVREVMGKSIHKELMPGKYQAGIIHVEDIKTIAQKYGIDLNSDKN